MRTSMRAEYKMSTALRQLSAKVEIAIDRHFSALLANHDCDGIRAELANGLLGRVNHLAISVDCGEVNI